MVVKAGLEPARRLKHKILNLFLVVDSHGFMGLFYLFSAVLDGF